MIRAAEAIQYKRQLSVQKPIISNLLKFTEADVCHLLEGQRGLVPVLVPEVVVHAKVSLPAELIAGLTVRNTFNHATLKEPNRKSR